MFGSAGFTLVELLVAMALLSLLMLGMASALRSMAQ
ncbi:MAG: prepilin-type N-terminal cleavage/methylation domain-containing protein, partial [Comamonadaceae bacterium]|nr:prepilin-type N-terminal cleavage/methylation domain-containing protein [Comamonadaceae bacterium]